MWFVSRCHVPSWYVTVAVVGTWLNVPPPMLGKTANPIEPRPSLSLAVYLPSMGSPTLKSPHEPPPDVISIVPNGYVLSSWIILGDGGLGLPSQPTLSLASM